MRQPAALLDHRLVRPRQHRRTSARRWREAEKQLAEIARRSNAFAQAKSSANEAFHFPLLRIGKAFYTSLHEGLHHASPRRACPGGKRVASESGREIRKILLHGPWPPPWRADRATASPASSKRSARRAPVLRAAALRHRLGALRTCHVPFGLSRRTPACLRLEQVERNTPSLLNAALQRAVSAGTARGTACGRKASGRCWSRGDAGDAGARRRGSEEELFKRISGGIRAVSCSDEEILVDVGKALAAFQEPSSRPARRSTTSATRWSATTMPRLSLAAQRGLRISSARATAARVIPARSSPTGGFADTGAPFLVRVPGLRNVARTAPLHARRQPRDAARRGALHSELNESEVEDVRRVPRIPHGAVNCSRVANSTAATASVRPAYSSQAPRQPIASRSKPLRKSALPMLNDCTSAQPP